MATSPPVGLCDSVCPLKTQGVPLAPPVQQQQHTRSILTALLSFVLSAFHSWAVCRLIPLPSQILTAVAGFNPLALSACSRLLIQTLLKGPLGPQHWGLWGLL